MTPFALLINLAGLSQREAGATFGISPSMIDKMTRGHRAAPQSLLDDVRDLIDRQDEAATQAIQMIMTRGHTEVEIGYPADDYEAQALGWPCVGAWRAMAARVVAALDGPVTLTPRGSSLGAAGAAAAHDAVTSKE